MGLRTRTCSIAALIAALVLPILPVLPGGDASARSAAGGRDAVVVAVIDSGFTPYHWDYLASKMPARARVPLGRAPHKWLRGFPRPGRFDSFRSLSLSLEERNADALIQPLYEKDEHKWESMRQSSRDEVHYHWIPDTKVIGALRFGESSTYGDHNAHGTGTSSVSVGNLHGTCPECLLVFISFSGRDGGEAAIEWALRQPWIDAITNSYGFSLAIRDRLYSGSNTELQRRASARGQTIFFSAGNGQANTFTIPNTTLFSSQEGPDWIVTVGAISPESDSPAFGSHASYTGHGKPADVASLGLRYPAAYGSPTVGGTGSGGFGGTSNSTPVVAGLYARALFEARRVLPGPSRVQRNGVIARGPAVGCGRARRRCELGNGTLTAVGLRRRLFHGAVHTEAGMTTTVLGAGNLPPLGEDEFLNEGHGSYLARSRDDKEWLKEVDRIVGPMAGRRKVLERPEGEKDWMTVLSFCRQHLWGNWRGGYYKQGRTDLPGPDPGYPVRTSLETTCPAYRPPP